MADPTSDQSPDGEEFVPTDEHRALRAMVDDYVQRRWDDAGVRARIEGGAGDGADGADGGGRGDLRVLGSELGVLGLAVPESLGGGGAGLTETAVVAERLGRALAPVPFVSSLLAAEALVSAGADELLAQTLRGDRLAVVVATDEHGRWLPEEPTVSARTQDGSVVLSGTAAHVVDAPGADVLLVLAGDALHVVDARAPGVRLEPVTSLDQTRPQATVVLDSAPARPLDTTGSGRDRVAAAADRAVVCVAAEALGAAERLLEVASEYAATRLQFGRAIGSYQGVKHRLADLLVAVEQTRSVVEHAAWSADPPDADDPKLAASMARVVAAEALVQAAETTVQVHGGIGFTWEHPAHLYYKRAHSDLVLWGGLAPHRERVARLVLDNAV